MERPDEQAPQRSPAGREPLRRLLGYARPQLALIALTLLLGGLLSGSQLLRAYLMKPVFDEIILPGTRLESGSTGQLGWPILSELPGTAPDVAPSGEDASAATAGTGEQLALLEEIRTSLDRVLWIALGLVVATPLLLFAREYTVQYVLGRIDLDMKIDVCDKLLALPLRFHQEHQRGDIMQRILNDTTRAQSALEMLFGDFLQSALMIAIGVIGLLFVSWKLSLVLLLVGPVIALVISAFSRRVRRSARRRQEQSGAVTQRLVEIIGGIKVIKAFRAESLEGEGFRQASLRLFRRGMQVVKNRVMARSLIDGLNNLAAIGVLIFGIWLVLGGYWGLTPGDLGAFVAMSTTIYKPVRALAKGYVRLVDAAPSAERFFEVIDQPLEILEAEDAVSIGRLRERVRFDQVTFSYGRAPVLDRVSFDVGAGEVVAIVGRTGAGKTTLADLLLRLYDPQSGAIEIDGVDLRRIRRDSLLDQIAVVTQDPFLFDGTIADNIRYGRPDASEAEVMAAARAAYVDEFASALPEGYRTPVGAGGTRLSGGQRQRVTIARAILRDPALLILDEATSSLDSEAERRVQDALDALLPGRTVFVIAHRLATVRRADKIVVLEGGRVAQAGTHEELVAAGGLYRDLVQLQSRAGDELAPPLI